MNRQYIGARYVPKIMGEYNPTLAYESLSIVTYLNNSFTSKKPVPQGVTPDNTEYWSLTGNYNAQVEQYRQEVEEVKQVIDNLTNRKIIYVSDSYGESPTATENWIDFSANYLGLEINKSYWKSVNSGGGFQVNGSNQFLDGLKTIDTGINEDITDIVVGGGINDANTVQNNYVKILEGIKAFCDYVKLTYPKAKIWIGFIGYCNFNGIGATNVDKITYLNSIRFYQDATGINGASWLSNGELVLHNWGFLNSSDNLHPTLEGAYALSQNISACLNGGGYTPMSYGEFAYLTGTEFTINGTTERTTVGLTYLYGGVGSLQLRDLVLVNSTGVEIGNDFKKIANYDSPILWFNDEFVVDLTVQAITVETQIYKNYPIQLKFHKGDLYMRSLYINSGTFEVLNITTILMGSRTLVVSNMC